MKKILLGCITYNQKNYVWEKWKKRVRELTIPEGYSVDILIVDNSDDDGIYSSKIGSEGFRVITSERFLDTRNTIATSRNILRQEALDKGYNYLFCLESDVIPPKDILVNLVKWGVPVVSGWYYVGQGNDNKRPCVIPPFQEIDYDRKPISNYSEMWMSDKELAPVFLGSMGCCLIERGVLEKIHFHHLVSVNPHQKIIHDDTFFFCDCEAYGFQAYVDVDMLCNHFQSAWYKDFVETQLELRKQRLNNLEVN